MNDLKQKYWALEAKYERWPPCQINKYTQEQLNVMDASFNVERIYLFNSYGIIEERMEKFKDFMSVSYDFKPDFISDMVAKCSKSETWN